MVRHFKGKKEENLKATEKLWRKSVLLIWLLTIIFGYVIFILSGDALQASRPQNVTTKLFKNNHELFVTLKARGEKEALIVIASKPEMNNLVTEAVVRLGGTVRYREDAVDYLSAKIPLDQISVFAQLKEIERIDIDFDYYLIDPTRKYPPPQEEPPSDPPDPDTPLSQPALPTKDIDAEEFLKENPTFDGRGVGFALIDGNIDVLLPEFQKATSLDGKEIPKVADLLAASDPLDDIDPMWVNMEKKVTIIDKKFTFQDFEFTALEDGEYRFGLFDERALEKPAYIHKDVNFDENPEGSSGLFGILLEDGTNKVWVDTNQDKSFADENSLTEYAKKHDIGIFGKDKPETPRRELVGFAVQLDKKNKYIRLNLGIWQHGTMVAGAAVGSGFYGGKYDGIAPGAQIISIFPSMTMHGLIEGAILAAQHEKVDVICLEPGIHIPAMYTLNDGCLVASLIFDRLVDKYQKLIFCPANNYAGVTTILDYIVGKNVIGVGGYQSQDSYRVNYGAEVSKKDNLHFVSSFGPGGNGALVPDILSSSGIISTDCGYKPPARIKGVFELPPGYSIAGGTSTAGPSATAACALLISAAKQKGVRWEADRLRNAILSTARYLPEIETHKQGNGLIQVNAAWKLLKSMGENYKLQRIESMAPVKTAISSFLAPPDEGVGIFEREGWTLGQKEVRTIVFKRTTGESTPITDRIGWVGNDGTFSSPKSVTLPLNQPVKLPVHIAAESTGVHSAIMNLHYPKNPRIAYQMLNTIIVAEQFSNSSAYTVINQEVVECPGTKSFFLHSPPDIQALQLALEFPQSSIMRVSTHPSTGYQTRLSFEMAEKGSWKKNIMNPAPGVWEILIWNNQFAFMPDETNPKPLIPTSVKFKAKLISVEAVSSVPEIQNFKKGGSFPIAVDIRNQLAPSLLKTGNCSLASVFLDKTVIEEGNQKIYEIDVPKGVDLLKVQIGQSSSPKADLDLYAFEMVEGTSVLRKKSNDLSSDEMITIENPNSGRWQIIVDAFNGFSGKTEFTYKDYFTHSLFGEIKTDDVSLLRAHGESWQSNLNINVSAIPLGRRSIHGLVPIIWSPEKQKEEKVGREKDELVVGFLEILFKEQTDR